MKEDELDGAKLRVVDTKIKYLRSKIAELSNELRFAKLERQAILDREKNKQQE